jgi:hypothetical protein
MAIVASEKKKPYVFDKWGKQWLVRLLFFCFKQMR